VSTTLDIRNLHVNVEGNEILKGLSLTIRGGEVHAIMGPNGSGKSTLAYTLTGHPRYEVTEGSVTLDGQDILSLTADARSRAGLFLAFQYPSEVPGVSVANFLRTAINARRGEGNEISVMEFARKLREKMTMLEMDNAFAGRYLNEGFSGGEKKRNEILQMAMLEPKIAILDEADSGLDIDALRIVANGVNQLRNSELGVVVITHYQRILRYLKPDVVHVLMNGQIVRSGGNELAEVLEDKGYDWIKEELEGR
jgi:Fe-S cluster assembly ATP-binding protein